jgi:hypothetical protein
MHILNYTHSQNLRDALYATTTEIITTTFRVLKFFKTAKNNQLEANTKKETIFEKYSKM